MFVWTEQRLRSCIGAYSHSVSSTKLKTEVDPTSAVLLHEQVAGVHGETYVMSTPSFPSASRMLPAGLDENGSASFAEDVSACLHADAKRRRLMTAVTDRRAPKCFL